MLYALWHKFIGITLLLLCCLVAQCVAFHLKGFIASNPVSPFHNIGNLHSSSNIQYQRLWTTKQGSDYSVPGIDNFPAAILVEPRGFCEGVRRAIGIVEEALRVWGAPIYVRHNIVHNEVVCDQLTAKGVIFIEDLKDAPENSICIFSAHGVSQEVRKEAAERKLIVIDATCPLVNKVHVYVRQKAEQGYQIILIGHKNHVETIGTYGQAPNATHIIETVQDAEALNYSPDTKLFYATQTTLSMDDYEDIVKVLKEKYPNIETIPSGSICYATTNRQTAVRRISPQTDLTLVIGSNLSSNAKRLVEAAQNRGARAYLINSAHALNPDWFNGVKTISITASASTPEYTIDSVINELQKFGITQIVSYKGAEERKPTWKFPKELLAAAAELDGQGTAPQ